MTFAINTLVMFKESEAEVLEYKSGWYTLLLGSGDHVKAREKDLTEVVNSSPSESDEERTMKDQMAQARKKYTRIKNYAGESSMDCGDTIAELLRGLEPEEVCRLADEVLGEPAETHLHRYGHLNRGQQRMNAGNRIRGVLRKGKVTEDDVREAYKGLGLVAMGQDAA